MVKNTHARLTADSSSPGETKLLLTDSLSFRGRRLAVARGIRSLSAQFKSWLSTFQPSTVTTGVAPPRAFGAYAASISRVSPGRSVR